MATVAIPAVETKDSTGAVIPGPSVVAAQDLTRRYGEGDTAVDALRGVSLDVTKGKLAAVMGPSGSGKSTLMHILAGLDKATSGEVTIAGTGISKLNDTELTLLRRQHIGFIFQFFNLLLMLNAEENVVLPLSLAGQKAGQEVGRRADEQDRPRRSPAAIGPRSSRAGSSSGSRSAGRWSASRRSSSQTSRPATWIRRPAERSSSSCAIPSTGTARRR